MKEVNFIYSRNKLDFKKYYKNTEYDDIISYHDIITKLVKNDDDNDRPSEIVVNTYLRKKILRAMSEPSINTVVYALKELDLETIESVIEIMADSLYKGGEFKANLIIIEHKKFKVKLSEEDKFRSIFNNISFIKV